MRQSNGLCILSRPNVQAIKLTFTDKDCKNETSAAIVNNSQCFQVGDAKIDGVDTPVSMRVSCDYGSHDSRYEAKAFASADCSGYKINDFASQSSTSECHRVAWGVPSKVKVDCSAVARTPCVVSDWSSWSSCDASCDAGYQVRTRAVTVKPSGGGEECPVLRETRPCNLGPCPRPAVVTPWSAWSTCSASCGGGVRDRTRQIISPAIGGNETTITVQTVPCNKFACPVDCVVAGWGEWSSCSTSCGGGVSHRERAVTTQPANGGKACPDLSQSRGCNNLPCNVDCKMSDWANATACSEPCGAGYLTRHRTVVTPSAFEGAACGDAHLHEDCNAGQCPAACTAALSDWGT